MMIQEYIEDHLDSLLATGVGLGPQKWAFLLYGSTEDKQCCDSYMNRLRTIRMLWWLHG